MAERRPALTASVRVGVGNLRSGRKKALRRGRTKESAEVRKKALALMAVRLDNKNRRREEGS
jgi:hypothetical protein